MQTGGEIETSLSPEAAFAFVSDPFKLAACIPGCSDLTEIGPNRYGAVLANKVGFINVKFNVVVEITGENLGLLVGPKGATLQALEELVRTVVQRQTGGHGVRINVDVEGYRAKRRAALETFTRDLVQRVLDTGREHALEPMSSPDRKVVHDVAAEMDGVETISEGEEPRRRVVIRPSA